MNETPRERAIYALRHLDGEGFNDSYLGRNDLNTDESWRSVEDLVDVVLAALADVATP